MPRAFRLDHATNRKDHLIDPQRRPRGGRHQIGIAAGFGSEQVAGFRLECMAGFVGIRTDIWLTRKIGGRINPNWGRQGRGFGRRWSVFPKIFSPTQVLSCMPMRSTMPLAGMPFIRSQIASRARKINWRIKRTKSSYRGDSRPCAMPACANAQQSSCPRSTLASRQRA